MPRGRVWPKDLDSIQVQVLAALVAVYSRGTSDANALLQDLFPAGAFNMLPEWEETLGFPDPCAGSSPSVPVRRSQVLARFIGNGGQSINYFVAFAKTLGYDITITQFKPWRFGDTFGLPLNGPDWAHAWQVNAPQASTKGFTFGVSGFGESFASFGNTVLECEIKRYAPAHTVVNFFYS